MYVRIFRGVGMEIINKIIESKKYTLVFTILTAICFLSAICIAEPVHDINESSVITMVVGALVAVLIAVNLLPIIANNTAELENNTDLTENEQSLVGTWDILIIIGVMIGIVAMAVM